MRVLVVYSHPVPESYCAALRDTVVSTLKRGGHEVRLLDLYAEGFDPVMGCEERRVYNTLTADDHPMPERAGDLRWAEAMVFVYPTWWYGLPAMLKGWFDRVWTPNLTFTMPTGGPIRPIMTHVRKVAVVTTCGAPRWWSYLVGHPGKRTILRGVRALFARRCRTLFLAHYMMDHSTPQSRAAFLARVERAFARF
ncbi:MAG: NAD(P)H-dependent oxidoreductase [Pseudomonadota bacterium]|nr:NAD(P)H-dependent oxidoreductase [Pseudomonadota bacterium]